MLFKCGHDHAHDAHHSPSDATGGAPIKVERLGVRTVDIHCHLHVPEADALVKDVFDLENEPLLWFSNDETRKFQMAHGQLESSEAGIDLFSCCFLGMPPMCMHNH